MSGGPIVSVMPQSCMRGAWKRSSHSSSCAGVTLCAKITTRSLFSACSGRRGWASNIRMGAANRLETVQRWAIA